MDWEMWASKTNYALPERMAPVPLTFLVRFQKLLGINGGHASGTCGGDGLAVNVVLHIACCKYAFDVGLAAVVGNQISGFIHVELAFVNLGVWIMANANE
jgi:hypothetical protein